MNITTKFFLEAAQARGWQFEWVDEYRNVFMLLPPDEKPIIIRNSVTELSTGIGSVTSRLKSVTQILAERVGFAVPATVVVEEEDPNRDAAQALLARYQRLVVKPMDAAFGNGVSVDVATPESLETAIKKAQQHNTKSTGVMVQAFVAGKDFRLLLLRGHLIAAIQRSPLTLVGDGHTTLEVLLDTTVSKLLSQAENLIKPVKVQRDELLQGLAGHTLDEVPADGEEITVQGVANLSKGGMAIDVTEVVHPDTVALAAQLAELIQLDFCAIDVLSPDISAPPTPDTPVFLEANVAPGFRGHYFPAVGSRRDVAGMVLDAIAEKRKSLHKSIKSV